MALESAVVPLRAKLENHRRTVITIQMKTEQLDMLKDRTGAAFLVDELQAEIPPLVKKRLEERKELEALAESLKSDLQRKVIDCYYLHGMSWEEVARTIFKTQQNDHALLASDKRNCSEARNRAIAAMEQAR